jgi:hypothetical protein
MQNANLFNLALIELLTKELQPKIVANIHDSGNEPGESFIGHMMSHGYLQQAMLFEALGNAGLHVSTGGYVRWDWNGSFSEQFSYALLKRVIESLSLNQRSIANASGSDCRAVTLKYLLDQGHVTRDTFKIVVHDLLIVLGTASDELLRRNSTMKPRNLCSKHALGYAMHRGAIPECSWSAYPYAEQEGPKDYLALADGLLGDVMEQLLMLEDANDGVLADTESEPMRCGSVQ